MTTTRLMKVAYTISVTPAQEELLACVREGSDEEWESLEDLIINEVRANVVPEVIPQ